MCYFNPIIFLMGMLICLVQSANVFPSNMHYRVGSCEKNIYKHIDRFGINPDNFPREWLSKENIQGCFYAASKLCLDRFIPIFVNYIDRQPDYSIAYRGWMKEAALYGINKQCAFKERRGHLIPILEYLRKEELDSILHDIIHRGGPVFYAPLINSQFLSACYRPVRVPLARVRRAIVQQNIEKLKKLLKGQKEDVKLEALLIAIKEDNNDIVSVIRDMGKQLRSKLRQKLITEGRLEENRLVFKNSFRYPTN